VLPGSIEAARVHYQELIELPAWVNLSVIATGALAIGALLFKISSGDPSALMFDGGSLGASPRRLAYRSLTLVQCCSRRLASSTSITFERVRL
jgi:hypothetical protein